MDPIGPISPKIPRCDQPGQFLSQGLNSPPSSTNRPFYPVFTGHSPVHSGNIHTGGSTGTQSQESDSNSTEGNDRVSPIMGESRQPIKSFTPTFSSNSNLGAHSRMNYPIPLPGSQSGLASIYTHKNHLLIYRNHIFLYMRDNFRSFVTIHEFSSFFFLSWIFSDFSSWFIIWLILGNF